MLVLAGYCPIYFTQSSYSQVLSPRPAAPLGTPSQSLLGNVPKCWTQGSHLKLLSPKLRSATPLGTPHWRQQDTAKCQVVFDPKPSLTTTVTNTETSCPLGTTMLVLTRYCPDAFHPRSSITTAKTKTYSLLRTTRLVVVGYHLVVIDLRSPLTTTVAKTTGAAGLSLGDSSCK